MVNKLRFLLQLAWDPATYVLGLYSSWGTSQICPAWSPSEHLLTPALSPFGACVRSHAVRRRLFISLMTAAHISPNVFSLREFLNTHDYFLLCTQYYSYLLYIHHIHIFYLHVFVHNFISSDLPGRLSAHRFLCLLQLFLMPPLRFFLPHGQFVEKKVP
jgi:hypothetical protein